jgi:single-strand DNA-binding protein
MASFNKVILIGNLTRDPELRVSTSGLSICKFSIAVSRKYKDKEETTFVEIDAFGTTADNISKYFTKGKPILVEGRLKLDQWDDKESGKKRSKLGVVLESFQFIGGGKGDSGDSYADTSPPARSATAKSGDYEDDPDGDVPF